MSAPATSSKRKHGPSPEPSTFHDAFGTEMVDLYIGPEKKHYHVHKAILCRKIPYFDKMFNSGSQEAATNSATLPDDEPEAFDILLGWVYTNAIRNLEYTLDRNEFTYDAYGVYCLADKLAARDLMDFIMSAIIRVEQQAKVLASVKESKAAYEETPKNSPIRRYVVQMWYRQISYDSKDTKKANLQKLMENKDFAGDFISLIQGKKGVLPENPWKLPRCTFHQHEKEQECPVPEDN